MAAIGKIAGAIISPIGAALGLFDKPKPTPAAVPLPTMTPRSNSAVSDALARRRGSAANQRTGAGGAESSTSAKKSLMGQ